MQFNSLLKTARLGAVLIAVSFLFSSCKSMITEEQLAQMQQLRNKEKSLNEEIEMARRDISKLKGELDQRMVEVKKCNDDKDFVQQKLSQWPNVWPE